MTLTPLWWALLALIIIASSIPLVSLLVAAEPVITAVALLPGISSTATAILIAISSCAAFTGDVASYWLGRTFGTRLIPKRLAIRQRRRIAKARSAIRRRGRATVLVQRWLPPPSRGLVPALAGAGHQPFGVFAGHTALAAAVWGAFLVLTAHFVGPALLVALPVVMLVAFLAKRLATKLRPAAVNPRRGSSTASLPTR